MLTAPDVVHIIVNVAEVAAKQLLLNMPSLEGPWAADEKLKQQLLQLQLVVVAKFQTYWQPSAWDFKLPKWHQLECFE